MTTTPDKKNASQPSIGGLDLGFPVALAVVPKSLDPKVDVLIISLGRIDGG